MSFLISRVPIYRLSPQAFENETNKIVEQFTLIYPADTEEELLKQYQKNLAIFNDYKPYYNEVVGWVEIEVLEKEIILNIWKRDAKRLERKPKQEFYCAKFRFLYLDCWLYKNKSSAEILQELKNYILIAYETYFPKKRFLNLIDLSSVGEYIDWKKLMEDIVLDKQPKTNNDFYY